MLCGGMAFASMFAYITATPFVYIDYFHVKPQYYGLLFGLNIVGIMLGNVHEHAAWSGVSAHCRMISGAAFVSVRRRRSSVCARIA